VSDYIDCGLHFKFSRLDRLEPEFRADALVLGSAMHRAIADFQQERMVGNVLTVSDSKPNCIPLERTCSGQERYPVWEGEGLRINAGRGKRLLEVYHQSFPIDGLEVLAIEEPFFFHIDGLEVP